MKDKMFCSKCGAADQSPDSYCRQCGEWIADNSRRRGRFGRSSREHKIGKMRMLQIVSVGLSLASALIIINFLNGGDAGLLNVAVMCGFLVAAYQIATIIIGRKVLTPNKQDHENQTEYIKPLADIQPNVLNAADTGEFVTPRSVIENTTELLEPVPLYKAPNDRQN